MLKTIIVTFVTGLLVLASLPLTATIVGAGGDEKPPATGQTTVPRRSAPAADKDEGTPAARTTTRPTTSTTPARTPAQFTVDTTPTDRYVALGDSVAAGYGLPPVANPTGRDRTCKRSASSYPYIVAQAQGLELTHVACTGARATNLFVWQGVRNEPNPSRQISYIFAGGMPELVTITAGANDMRWSEFIYKCYTRGCGPDGTNTRITDTDVVDGLLVLLDKKYEYFFDEMELRTAGRPPRVVVTGYYNPVSEACLAQFPKLSPGELQWIGESVDKLNRTIENVVSERPYARFAPVDFSGHDICADDSWVIGEDQRERLHPTAEGQQAIADAVLRAL